MPDTAKPKRTRKPKQPKKGATLGSADAVSSEQDGATTKGRPTAYKAEYAKQAEKLCALGATDMDLADFFQVSDRTIYSWASKHPAFLQALKTGKDACDERVERSLYHRAVGYTFDSEKVFQFQGEVVRAKTREHVPPDTTAMIFWLKNRRKDLWRDKTEQDVNINVKVEQMTDEELDTLIATELGAQGAAVH